MPISEGLTFVILFAASPSYNLRQFSSLIQNIIMRSAIIILVIAAFLLPLTFCSAQVKLASQLSSRPELNSSGVKVDSALSMQQIENLFVLGKIWGFLKYYHPDVAKGIYNFDSCLFVILPKALEAKNKLQRDELLLDWTSSLGNENKYLPVAPPSDSLYSKPR